MLQIEALKTREGARQASDAIRQINPNLASAVIDERDEVSSQPYSTISKQD